MRSSFILELHRTVLIITTTTVCDRWIPDLSNLNSDYFKKNREHSWNARCDNTCEMVEAESLGLKVCIVNRFARRNDHCIPLNQIPLNNFYQQSRNQLCYRALFCLFLYWYHYSLAFYQLYYCRLHAMTFP